MDNYRELKIRCDPGFGHLPSLFRISLPERFNVFTTCCHNQYKLVWRKGIQYNLNHQNRGWMLTVYISLFV